VGQGITGAADCIAAAALDCRSSISDLSATCSVKSRASGKKWAACEPISRCRGYPLPLPLLPCRRDFSNCNQSPHLRPLLALVLNVGVIMPRYCVVTNARSPRVRLVLIILPMMIMMMTSTTRRSRARHGVANARALRIPPALPPVVYPATRPPRLARPLLKRTRRRRTWQFPRPGYVVRLFVRPSQYLSLSLNPFSSRKSSLAAPHPGSLVRHGVEWQGARRPEECPVGATGCRRGSLQAVADTRRTDRQVQLYPKLLHSATCQDLEQRRRVRHGMCFFFGIGRVPGD